LLRTSATRAGTQAHKLLVGLEERGYIRRKPLERRAIQVVQRVSRFEAFKFDPVSKALLPLTFSRDGTQKEKALTLNA